MDNKEKTTFDPKHSFVYRGERPWPVPRLKKASIVGHTTADSSKIWFRTAELGDFRVVVNPQGEPHQSEQASAALDNIKLSDDELNQVIEGCSKDGGQSHPFSVSDYADDTTYVVSLANLQPNALYRYWLLKKEGESDSWITVLGADKIGAFREQRGLSFRTLSASRDSAFSFALYSCHNPFVEAGFFALSDKLTVKRMDSWSAFAKTLWRYSHVRDDKRLAFVIAGGDQAYTDGREAISIWEYLYSRMRKDTNGELLPSAGTMLTWFRDIYRGYWGFPEVREVFANYPTYMIWDDHEIGDGWGSFDPPGQSNPHPIYKKLKDANLDEADGTVLLERMFDAAKEAYTEYEHSHNPDTPKGKYYYNFKHGMASYFVLDGRGKRNVGNKEYRIHGEEQIRDFRNYVEALDAGTCKFLFVVSAVPVLHLTKKVVQQEDKLIYGAFKGETRDDLRDGWEHELHDKERKEFKEILWKAAKKGIRVAILSGDVHASAAFRFEKEGVDLPIYQLTSSAITYHLSSFHAFVVRNWLPAGENGSTDDGESFTRLALSVKSPFAIIQVEPTSGTAVFQIYGVESTQEPEGPNLRTSSLARIELWRG